VVDPGSVTPTTPIPPIVLPSVPSINPGSGEAPKKVEKHPRFKFPCNKDALAVSDELKKLFTDLADYTNIGIGGISFEDKPIRDGARIEISTWLTSMLPLTKTFHVVVTDLQPKGWTFTTESDHVFYPGTITFSIVETNDGQLEFQIDILGETSGVSGYIGFVAGGGQFEDLTWEHLEKQIRTRICGNKK